MRCHPPLCAGADSCLRLNRARGSIIGTAIESNTSVCKYPYTNQTVYSNRRFGL